MRQRSTTLPRSLYAAIRKEAPLSVQLNAFESCTTIASYNIHKCVGTDGRFDPGRIAKVIGEIDADIIALQEADERLGDRQGLLDLEEIARETDLIPLHLPARGRSHGWHGNLILARLGAVVDVHPVRLPGLEPRGALIVDLDLRGVSIRIIAAHLGLLRRSRSRQTAALMEAANTVLRPTILLGDFNEWRVQTRSSLLSLLPHFGPIHAVLPSFPSRFPLLALDRILARPPQLIASIEVHQSPLARTASDHLPVKARLNLKAMHRGEVAHAGSSILAAASTPW